MNDWISRRSTKAIAGGSALGAGVWGSALALTEVYDIFFVNHSTSSISVVFIAAVLLNSIATCGLGLRALIDPKWVTFVARSSSVALPITARTIRASGTLLIVTGIAAIGFLLFAVYVVYLFRSVLPWNDPEDPLVLYRTLDVLVTSICACWLGFRLVRRTKPRFDP